MRLSLLSAALFAPALASQAADDAPLFLNASQLSIATGKPSLVLMSGASTHIPVWSLSGGTEGQSVCGVVTGLPSECGGVRVEITVTSTDAETSPAFEDVYRVHLSQMIEGAPFTARHLQGDPVRSTLPAGPLHSRTLVLNAYYKVQPGAPLCVRIQREPGDPADTFTRPMGLAAVKITPVQAPAAPFVVQDVPGYNSWPMLQAMGDKLVCVYTRGSGHTIGEDARATYARTSSDGGKTWTAETTVASSPGYGDVPVGKGLDSTGALLAWVRRVGKDWHQDLYRSTDGVNFTLVTTPTLDPRPVQITDIFSVPTVGLMALWFAGDYGDEGPTHSWGKLTSTDDGKTWTQTTIESGLTKAQWPTEPSAVHLGEGRILAIGRTEIAAATTERAQFQMTSTDHGKTWKREQTNITNVLISTPSLILDAKTGLLSNYYYQRGQAGVLWRRLVKPESVFEHPLHWPAPEAVAAGSDSTIDAGNVNATVIGDTHYLSYYSGKAPNTAVQVSVLEAPRSMEKK